MSAPARDAARKQALAFKEAAKMMRGFDGVGTPNEEVALLYALEDATAARVRADIAEKVRGMAGLRIVGEEVRVGNVTIAAHDVTLVNAVQRNRVLALIEGTGP